MTIANPFAPAVRANLKARVALDGPTGAGKTWTGLEWATVLAGPGGKVAGVDTENGRMKLYSDVWPHDGMEWQGPFDPGRLADTIKAAEANGYASLLIDSLSHFWEGEGGVMDIVDAAAERDGGGNRFAGWKVGTPALRHLIDTIIQSDLHIVVCMRSKMEYVLEENDRGKRVPRRVGMAPVMRAGVEYEFDLIGDLDLEHRLVISKSRCSTLADQVIQPHRAGEAAQTFAAWLGEGEALASRGDIDELVVRMNALGDRKAEAKRGFVERFGMPTGLRESQLADARAFVDEIEAGPASPAPSPGEGEPAPEGASPEDGNVVEPDGVNAVSSEGAPPAPPETDESPKAAFHRLVAELADGDKVPCDAQKLRHLVIHRATNGKTTNSQHADREALEAAVELLTQIGEGTQIVAVRSNGDFELRPGTRAA